jgi:Trk K+ transport system NAD-binding subunit
VTVVDFEPAKLKPLAQRDDVATFAASAVSGRELAAAGIVDRDAVIA